VGDNILRAEEQQVGFLLAGKLGDIDSRKELARHDSIHKFLNAKSPRKIRRQGLIKFGQVLRANQVEVLPAAFKKLRVSAALR
jgi:hypothetical protein